LSPLAVRARGSVSGERLSPKGDPAPAIDSCSRRRTRSPSVQNEACTGTLSTALCPLHPSRGGTGFVTREQRDALGAKCPIQEPWRNPIPHGTPWLHRSIRSAESGQRTPSKTSPARTPPRRAQLASRGLGTIADVTAPRARLRVDATIGGFGQMASGPRAARHEKGDLCRAKPWSRPSRRDRLAVSDSTTMSARRDSQEGT
jgi:hypothetical protein